MRKLLIICSASIAVLFLIAFVLTFLLKDDIYKSARSLAIEKTTKFSESIVTSAEEMLQSPLAEKVLSEPQLAAINGEIETYNSDPAAFVAELTSKTEMPPPADFKSKLSRKIFGWKESLRKHYNKILGTLISDLRLFCVTNIVAGVLGMILALKSGGKKPGILLLYCGILLAAIGLGIVSYFDHMSFLNIMINGFMGWEYPCFIVFVFLFIYRYFGRHVATNIENSP